MTHITYIDKRFSRKSQIVIDQARQIIEEYEEQGFVLTLRQLYYQFVTRGLLANKHAEYKRLGTIINDARLAGQISWESLEDRTRRVRQNNHWEKPRDILESARDSYAIDKWADQPYRPEVWIEKDALLGVIEAVCQRLDVPFFSCRGYTSQSEQWRAGRRFHKTIEAGQFPIIFHLGDHDPSGIDMTWDNWKRLNLFCGFGWESITACYDKDDAFQRVAFEQGDVAIKRLALNRPQIESFGLPPNPTKFTDTRAANYINLHGDQSWELDALDPTVLAGLVQNAVTEIRDDDLWRAALEREAEGRAQIAEFCNRLEDE